MRPYYEQDGISIYCGDVRDVLPTLPLLFHCAIADPPYGQTSLDWDRWPIGWLRVLSDRVPSLWCFGSLRMFMTQRDEFEEWGWRLSQDLVWEKHNGSGFHADRFKRVHEQMAHFYRYTWEETYHLTPTTDDATARTVRRKERPPHMGAIADSTYESHDGGPRLMRSVLYARSMHGRAVNETQKPETIVRPLIEYACPPGGLLLSPFCGSGTDLLVARATGRRAVGIDIREDQCEAAAKRLCEVLPMVYPGTGMRGDQKAGDQ